MVDGAPPQEPSSRPFEGALAIMASAFAAFDAEVAPRIPADGLSPVSQEDLRLKTPALRPVGCWWSGCAARAACRHTDAGRCACCRTRPESSLRITRAGAATCPVRRRRACGCSGAPAATLRASAQRRATRQPGARATRAPASARSTGVPARTPRVEGLPSF